MDSRFTSPVAIIGLNKETSLLRGPYIRNRLYFQQLFSNNLLINLHCSGHREAKQTFKLTRTVHQMNVDRPFQITETTSDTTEMPKQLMKISMERDSLKQKWGITIQGGSDLALTAKIASVKVKIEGFQ